MARLLALGILYFPFHKHGTLFHTRCSLCICLGWDAWPACHGQPECSVLRNPSHLELWDSLIELPQAIRFALGYVV